MSDLPIWVPIPDTDPKNISLDFNTRRPAPYVSPYTAPPPGAVTLDFWGKYSASTADDLRLNFSKTVFRYVAPAGSSVNLNFEGTYKEPSGGNTNLEFADVDTSEPEKVSVYVSAGMPGPGASIKLKLSSGVQAKVQMATLGSRVEFSTDVNVFRGPSVLAQTEYQSGELLHPTTTDAATAGPKISHGREMKYQQASDLFKSATHTNQGLDTQHGSTEVAYETGISVGNFSFSQSWVLPRKDLHRTMRAQQGVPLSLHGTGKSIYLPKCRIFYGSRYEMAGPFVSVETHDHWQWGKWSDQPWIVPYENTKAPGKGTSPVVPWVPRDPVDWPDYPGTSPNDPGEGSGDTTKARKWCRWGANTTLNFEAPLPGHANLNFYQAGACPVEGRIYVVQNSAQIIRVSDSLNIPATSVTMSIDADSWAWTMSANVAGRNALALVEGTNSQPVEVDVTINGKTWRVLVDGWQLKQAWESGTGSITGRSLSAYLAAPYSETRDYTETETRTAQQLAQQELPFGWELDWQIDDWIVPGGAWSYQGLSPIQAVSNIAAAAGAYVQTHPYKQIIQVMARYPQAPWSINTADGVVEVPQEVLLQRSSSKSPGKSSNKVFVHGKEPGGVLAAVRRSGTAGDRLAPTVVDALITDATVARARGLCELAKTGRKSEEGYELPLSDTITGLILPGSVVSAGSDSSNEFEEEWRGYATALSVKATASRANNGGTKLVVRQSVTIERHFEDN